MPPVAGRAEDPPRVVTVPVVAAVGAEEHVPAAAAVLADAGTSLPGVLPGLGGQQLAQAVTYQRVTFDARAPRCGRYVCATAGRVNWT
jgi:hypothetical protein